jgi:hypothetical protein
MEYVLVKVDQAISSVEEALNHHPETDHPEDNAFDYMCAEIRHQVTSRLIRELAKDLERTLTQANLHQ